MHDSNAIKEEIRQRVDLVELVAEHVSLARSGKTFRGLCPFHKEKTPSFHVIPDKMIFHCFGCKAGGDVFKFVQLRENVSFGEAIRILADRAGIELRSRSASPHGGPGRADLARVNEWAADFYRKQLLDRQAGDAARSYLAERGISTQSAERFGLGLATDAHNVLQRAAALAGISNAVLQAAGLVRNEEQGATYDTFRHRLMFPIRDATRRVVGFGGRTLGEARAKYLNTPQNELFDKGRLLYGLDLARTEISSTGRSIVVEGYTDCIACHQAGFGSTVATLGTAMTESHVN
ncbi:MAG TPA: DNA primase, partial [Phycisphaerae bacterium]|nr:DNA primase [Phycisphaerae bacterium]